MIKISRSEILPSWEVCIFKHNGEWPVTYIFEVHYIRVIGTFQYFCLFQKYFPRFVSFISNKFFYGNSFSLKRALLVKPNEPRPRFSSLMTSSEKKLSSKGKGSSGKETSFGGTNGIVKAIILGSKKLLVSSVKWKQDSKNWNRYFLTLFEKW